MIQSYKEKYEIMAKTISISVEKFIDYLSPILYELGTEVIQVESPTCYDTDGYGYLAKSRHIFYKYGTESDTNEQEMIERMAEDMKREVESRQRQKMVGNITLHTERLGIYTIRGQYDYVKDEDLEAYHLTKEMQHSLCIFVRYSFGDKERKLQGIKKVGNGKN